MNKKGHAGFQPKLLKTKRRKKSCGKMKISLDSILESGILTFVRNCALAMPGRFVF
jgi:hypothetical protein